MIQLGGRASWLIVDTTRIELEGLLGGIDGDGRWTNLPDGGEEGGLGSRWDVLEAGDSGTLVGSVVLASVRSSGGVRVRGLSVNSVVRDDVLESLVHKSTIATLISLGSRAVNQVLLRERDERTLLDFPGSLHRSRGREGPARSTLALVLNWSNGSLGSPVDGGRRLGVDLLDGESRGKSGGGVRDAGNVHAIVACAELFAGHVRELVVSNSESSALWEGLNELVVGTEDFESPVVFLLGGVDLGEGNLVVAPVSLDTDILLVEGGEGNGSKKS